jgi:hypothetical protein
MTRNAPLDPAYAANPDWLAASARVMVICMTVAALAEDDDWTPWAVDAYAAQTGRDGSRASISKARAVMRYRPDLAEHVAAGRLPLGPAYDAVREARRAVS